MRSTYIWLFFVVFPFSVPSRASEPVPMEYVEICKREADCKRFSRLVMGTDHLVQSEWTGPGEPGLSEAQAFEVLDTAVKHGINFFDTAPIYVGDVEHRLGKWKQARLTAIQANEFYLDPAANPDRKLYVLSKGGFPFDLLWAKQLDRGTHSPELKAELEKRGVLEKGAVPQANGTLPLRDVPAGSYASRLYGDATQIAERVAEELGHTTKNLNNDITIYLMHRDDGDAVAFRAVSRAKTPVPTLLQGLAPNHVSGKFWMLGWSNWETDRVNESVALAAQRRGLPAPAINSPYFSLFEMGERSIHALGVQVTHQEMMDPEFQKGIKIMPYSPLGGFSILDKPEPRWENAKKAAYEKFVKADAYWQNVYLSIFTPANEARWHRVVAFTQAYNDKNKTSYTVDQMMNAYVLAHPRTDLLAIGAISVAQVQRTVGSLALSKRLKPADLEYLYSGH